MKYGSYETLAILNSLVSWHLEAKHVCAEVTPAAVKGTAVIPQVSAFSSAVVPFIPKTSSLYKV